MRKLLPLVLVLFASNVFADDKRTAELKMVAARGYAQAQAILGHWYETGKQGVPKDLKEAAKWYHKAADQGHAKAQNSLGVMYANGRGVLKDDKESIKWYRKAAEQGYAEAQVNLGIMYAKGRGVPEDLVNAYAWYSLAHHHGDEAALKNRDDLSKKMTPEQVVKAQGLSKELVKKIEANKKNAEK